jgi:uroporphyrinogen decarboxylase
VPNWRSARSETRLALVAQWISRERRQIWASLTGGAQVKLDNEIVMSPQHYREYIKPRHAELFRAQRETFPGPFYVFFHSDGAIYELIPDFIELGIDVLNPVQVSAKGMSTRRLKQEFGHDLAFWGGAIDPGLFAKSRPQDVRRSVGQSIEDLAAGGGFIFGAIHNIQDDVPPENIVAMLEVFQEMRAY